MNIELTSDEIALVSLLDDDDDFVQDRVKKAIAGKGLYGIKLLNSQGFHYATTDEHELSTEIFFEILGHELQSELKNANINLEKCAYLLSLIENDFYPFSDITAYLNRISELVLEHNGDATSQFKKLDALNEMFFGKEGFTGNSADFYNVRNSLINHVIQTKKGIPLTLTILYIAIAGRIGLAIEGLALPGHFMCKFNHASFTGVIDVFNGGRLLSYNEAHWFLASMGHEIDVEKFPTAGKKEIVLRLLKNLESVYTKNNNDLKAKQVERFIEIVSDHV